MRSSAAMRRLIAVLVLILLPALALAPGAAAQMSVVETDDLRLVYLDPTQTYLAPWAARCFENSLRFHRKLFDYTPWEKPTVFLMDFADDGNAFATAIPKNFLGVQIAPQSFAYETYPSNERLNTLMNHELVHVAAQDKAAARDRAWRRFFGGKVIETSEHPETIFYDYLTVPRRAAPRWYQEGLAVFIETWMSGGIGRAQGSYDEMVFRSMVRDNSRFYDPLGLASEGTKIDFQLEANSYLYGTRFMSWLAWRYSPELLMRWVSRSDGSKAYYSSQFRQVFGTKLDDAWQDWIGFERGFQSRNLEAIRQHPVTPYKDLSARALGSVSRAFLDPATHEVYAAFNYPGVVAHIGAISLKDGSVRRIHDVKDPVMYTVTSLAWDPAARVLYYTTDNNALRDLVRLDPATGKTKVLLKDARIGDLVFNRADRSIWGLRYFNGLVTLVRIPAPYTDWKQVLTFDYGKVLYDLDISPDGRLLAASVGDINGHHRLQVMTLENLLNGDATAVAELDFGTTIPSNFVFTPDGRYLVGSSYYTGVSNIFRFEIGTRDLQALSNCETGLFRPLPADDGQLIAFRYTGGGFVPATIPATPVEDVSAITFFGDQVIEKQPVLKEWMAGSPKDIPLDSMVTFRGKYTPFKSIGFESWYPVVEGYKDTIAGGASFRFADPLMINKMTLSASFTPGQDLPSNERVHARFNYERYDWKVALKYNPADFYDLFGPTKVSRKGYSAAVGYNKGLISDEPRHLDISAVAAFFGNIDRLPSYQNIQATFDKLSVAEARLTYRDIRSSLGAVDSEKGLMAEAIAGFQYEDGTFIPNLVGNFDFGIPLPLRSSSVWLRTSLGAAHGDVENPFANFYFGGFGNNYVDHAEVKRYRQWYSFPGVPLNSIGGTNFAKAMVEWNLPPLRFRKAGTPGFYASWMRTSIFATGIETNLDQSEFRRKVGDVGAQLDFRFIALSRQPLTLSIGYATAFESGQPSQDEFMISLKVLR